MRRENNKIAKEGGKNLGGKLKIKSKIKKGNKSIAEWFVG